MSKTNRKYLYLSLLCLVLSIGLDGCEFPESLSAFLSEGFVSVSVSEVSVGPCVADENDPGLFDCLNNGISSTFGTLTLQELISVWIMLDPLVVQFPTGATNFNGSYFHVGSGTGGALEITEGLSSVRIDVDRELTAEPGTQLVVIGLPAGAPTQGTFNFNLNFEVPPGATDLAVKPIITGLVELTDSSIFYPPVLPCVDAMGDAPTLTTPLPVPGDTVLLPPLTADLGCDNVTYNFIPTSLGNDLYLPIIVQNTADTPLGPQAGFRGIHADGAVKTIEKSRRLREL